jgi:hypothetical protein
VVVVVGCVVVVVGFSGAVVVVLAGAAVVVVVSRDCFFLSFSGLVVGGSTRGRTVEVVVPARSSEAPKVAVVEVAGSASAAKSEGLGLTSAEPCGWGPTTTTRAIVSVVTRSNADKRDSFN